MSPGCSFPDCDRPHYTATLCCQHRRAQMAGRPLVALRDRCVWAHPKGATTKVIEMFKRGAGIVECAEASGLTERQIHGVRSQYRRMGGSLPAINTGPRPNLKPRPSRAGKLPVDRGGTITADMAEAAKVPRCPRCFLMLDKDHQVCDLPRRAVDYAAMYLRAEGGARDLR
jgi:hypothetical protein